MMMEGTGEMTLTSFAAEILVHILSYLPGDALSAVSQTCRTLNSIARLESLWHALCRPINSHAPYQSWYEMYSTIWFQRGWLVGLWSGDIQDIGDLAVFRYNPKTGAIDMHHVTATCTRTDTIYSVSSVVHVSNFFPRVRPMRKPKLSIPPTKQPFRDTRVFTSHPNVFFLRRQFDLLLPDAPNPGQSQLWPTHWKLSTNHPSFPPLVVHQTPSHMCSEEYVLQLTTPWEGRQQILSIQDPTRQYHQIDVLHQEFFGRIPRQLIVPTPERPYAGLWVGDYITHGVEFLLFLQRTPTMLQVVKVTGDTNVPFGEYSFVSSDISTPTRICEEREFHGCNAYAGAGQISDMSFNAPRWIDVELILISHDEIAVYWKGLGHISNYKRVVLEDIFHPDHFGTDILDEEETAVQDFLFF